LSICVFSAAIRGQKLFSLPHLQTCGKRRLVSTLWYFAYGSNMASETLRGRREVEYTRALAARVPGWRLVLDKPPLVPVGHSFANIVADADAEVYGVLFAVGEADLDHIELTEGVRIGNYDRVAVMATPLTVEMPQPVPAFSLTSHRRDPALQPSQRYMEILIAGALEHSLPDSYVEYLRSISTVSESEEALSFRAFIDDAMRRR
jgi:hypothetical protein